MYEREEREICEFLSKELAIDDHPIPEIVEDPRKSHEKGAAGFHEKSRLILYSPELIEIPRKLYDKIAACQGSPEIGKDEILPLSFTHETTHFDHSWLNDFSYVSELEKFYKSGEKLRAEAALSRMEGAAQAMEERWIEENLPEIKESWIYTRTAYNLRVAEKGIPGLKSGIPELAAEKGGYKDMVKGFSPEGRKGFLKCRPKDLPKREISQFGQAKKDLKEKVLPQVRLEKKLAKRGG